MNQFFNANHSPVGAYASFTLGFPGAGGGPSIASEGPAAINVYIGAQKPGEQAYQALPFFRHSGDESKRYDVEKETPDENGYFEPYAGSAIKREFGAGTDSWMAGDLCFTLYTPAHSVPNPDEGNTAAMKRALLPAVLGEIEIDNSHSDSERLAFFGCDGQQGALAPRRFQAPFGLGWGNGFAMFTDEGAHAAVGFCPECIFAEEHKENWNFNLGKTALLLFRVPARSKRRFRIALCFFHEGTATWGPESRYYYTQLFSDISDVGHYALSHFEEIAQAARITDSAFTDPSLSCDRQFMLNHAIRSYYNSTQLLYENGKPLWVVNEGEFRMMNTLDLTVDQLFFEMRMNPWTVRNVLEQYYHRYSYRDQVRFPNETRDYPGGLTFCHDMGVGNQFAPGGHSCYEKAGLTGCFSFMSHEQLVNWLCCALVYCEESQDESWAQAYGSVIEQCFESMLNRDHPDSALRNGLMALDSVRTKGGAEITTYDSLDASLGQARNNIYLAGKCWAVYVSLERFFLKTQRPLQAQQAKEQAKRCAASIAAALDDKGVIPAIIGEGNDSKIIPAIEGLVFPAFTGCIEALDENGEFATYIRALKTHFKNVLKPGVCLFDDGGWKLSSTSDNSWLSKIYLSQYVASQLLGFDETEWVVADAAHVKWLTHPEHSFWCWSDQIVAGNISASKYYPRGVTAILWQSEKKK